MAGFFDTMKTGNDPVMQEVESNVSQFNDLFKQLRVENIQGADKLIGELERINALFDAMKRASDVSQFGDQYEALARNIGNVKTTIEQLANVNMNNNSFKELQNDFSQIYQEMSSFGKEMQKVLDETMVGVQNVGQASQQAAERVAEVTRVLSDTQNLMAKSTYDARLQTDYLVKDIKSLNETINGAKGETVDFFEKLNQMSQAMGKEKFGDLGLDKITAGLPAAYAELERFADNIKGVRMTLDREKENIAKNPTVVSQEYDRLYESMQKIFNLGQGSNSLDNITGSIDKMLGKSDMIGTLQVMENFMPKMEEYKKVLSGSKESFQSFYDVLQAQGLQDNAFLEKNRTMVEAVKEQIDKLKEYEEKMGSGMQGTANRVFNQQISMAMDPGNDYYKLLSVATGSVHTDKYGNDMHRMGSYAMNAGHGAANLLDDMSHLSGIQKHRTNSAMDLENIASQAQSIENAMLVFDSKRKQLMENIANSVASYSMTGDDKFREQGQKHVSELLPINEMISGRVNNIGDLIKVRSKKEYDKLPEQAKKEIQEIHKMIKNTIEANGEIITLSKVLGLSGSEVDKLRNFNDELKNTDAALEKVDGKTKSWFKQLNEDLDLSGKLKSLSSLLGFVGVSSIPLSIGGLVNFGSGAVKDYMRQDHLAATTAWAEGSMGYDTSSDAALKGRVIDQGAHYYGLSHGLIGHEEYNNSYTNLVKNIGGHYGQDDASGRADMDSITQGTFLLGKMYNISDSTTAQAVQTFYKDLRMSADETVNVIKNLTSTAISANVPVDKYVQSVTQLAAQFRRIGLDGNTAVGMMDSFLNKGMTMEDATSMTQAVGNAVGGFGQNQSMMAYNGIMSGQFNNPFSAIRFGLDQYDESGKVRDNYGSVVGKSMDNWLQTQSALAGGNKDLEFKLVYDQLKAMGFSNKEASIGTNSYFKDPKMFEDFMNKTEPGSSDKEVKLLGQEELENKMEDISGHLSNAEKINADMKNLQWQIGAELGKLIDPVLGTLEKAIEELTKAVLGATKKIGDVIGAIADSKIGQAIGGWAKENPGLATAAGIGTVMFGPSVIKGGAKWAGGKLVDGAKGLFGGKSGAGSAKIGAEAAEEGVEAAEAAAKTAAESEGILAKMAGHGGVVGKIIGGTLLAGGALWGASKLFGGKTNDTGSASSTYASASGMSPDGENIYNKLDEIQRTLSGQGYGQGGFGNIQGYGPWSNSGMYSNVMGGKPLYDQYGNPLNSSNVNQFGYSSEDISLGAIGAGGVAGYAAYKGASSLINTIGGKQISSAAEATTNAEKAAAEVAEAAAKKAAAEEAAKQAAEEAARIQNSFAGSMTKEAAEKSAASRAASKVAQEAAEQAAKEFAEKESAGLLAKEVADKAGASAIMKLGGKTALKGITGAASAGLMDIAFGAGDFGFHAIKGDLMPGDGGRVVGETATNLGWTGIGAGIGTLIAPGVGTAVGAGIGGLAGMLANFITKDEYGRGINDKAADWISSGISGKTTDQVAKERALYNADPTKLMSEQFQSLGIDSKQAQKMAEALHKYGGDLSTFTNESKVLWAQSFSELISSGTDEKTAVNQAKEIITNGTLKDQLAQANAQGLKDALATQGIKISVEQAQKMLGTIESNVGDIMDIDAKKKSGASDQDVKDLIAKKVQKQSADKEDIHKPIDDKVMDILKNPRVMAAMFKDELDKDTSMMNSASGTDKTFWQEEMNRVKGFVGITDKWDEMRKLYGDQYDKDSSLHSKGSREQYIDTQLKTWIREVNPEFLSVIEAKQKDWIQNINDELDKGSTSTLDKLKQMTDAIDGTQYVFAKILADLANLQAKGDINIEGSDLLTENNSSNKLLQKMASAASGISVLGSNGEAAGSYAKALIGAGYKYGGSDTNGFDDEGFIKYIGQTTGMFDNFSMDDLGDSSKFSAVDISNVKVGDIVYKNGANKDQDDLEYEKNWMRLKKQGLSDDEIQKRLGNGSKPSGAGVYVGNGQVVEMMDENEAAANGTTAGARMSSVSNYDGAYRSNKAEDTYRKAAQGAADSTNDVLGKNNKDQLKAMSNATDQQKQEFANLISTVQSSALSSSEKQQIMQYLSAISSSANGAYAAGGSGGGNPKNPQGDQFGVLSRKYESSGDAGSIANDTAGTKSYGMYQFNEGSGTGNHAASDFLKWMEGKDPTFFSEEFGENNRFGQKIWTAGENNQYFQNAWKNAAAHDPNKFSAYQQEFAVKNWYDPAKAGLKNTIDMDQHSRALQEVLMSTAIQHGTGGAQSIFKQVVGAHPGASDSDLIKAVYALRAQKSPGTADRYQKEMQDALVLLSSFGGGSAGTSVYGNPGAGTSGVAGKMISYAQQQVGKSYLWGAEGAQDWDGDGDTRDGYDCSGLVSAAANFAGIGVGRLTAEGLRKKCTVITREQLKPGDLGFIVSGGEATHVGLYKGNGKWLEAANSQKGVIESTGGSFNTFGRLPGTNNENDSDNPTLPSAGGAGAAAPVDPLSKALTGNHFVDGTMLYNMGPFGASSYQNNDPNSRHNYLTTLKDLLNAAGDSTDEYSKLPNQQTLARNLRLKMENAAGINGSNDEFGLDLTSDPSATYAPTTQALSNSYSSFESSANPNNYAVTFTMDKKGEDDAQFQSFVKQVTSFISNLGGQIKDVKSEVANVRSNLDITNANIAHNNSVIYDNMYRS